jgi:hypothetical protein
MLPPKNVKGLGTYVGKRGKTGITSNLTEHNSTRMQPTLQISHGKLQPKPGKQHSVTSETQDSSLEEETLATTSAVGLSSRKQEKI